MNKNELVTAIANEANVSKRDTNSVLDAFVKVVTDELSKKEKITLVGFGTFETRDRAARTGRNPATGEEIKIAASVSPAFKPGKALKDAVNNPKKKKK